MSAPRRWSWNLSPFAGKARIALAETGVEVELIEIDPRNRAPRLRELNPTNRVPVLEVGDVAIRESTAICEWAHDTAGGALWPDDAADRAVARGLLRFVDDELTVNFFLSMRKQAFGLEETDHPDIVTILRDRLVRRWATVERLLGQTEGPWLIAGDEPTLADLAAIPLAVRLPAWMPELAPDAETHPATAAWLGRLRDRPSAVEVDRTGEPAAA